MTDEEDKGVVALVVHQKNGKATRELHGRNGEFALVLPRLYSEWREKGNEDAREKERSVSLLKSLKKQRKDSR